MNSTQKHLLFVAVTAALAEFTALPSPAATNHVWQESPSPGPPYATWATAAHTIQDAVDAAQAGDTVLVTNGVYATGGRAVGTSLLTNRVAVDKPITLQSVNGPQVTIIEGAKAPGGGNGDGSIRCVDLTNGAVLSGFTLTNGATREWQGDSEREQSGGGLWCESTNAVISNCVLTGNSAYNGGGAYEGTLNNCTLTGNSASQGGGACASTLNNCTLVGNSAGGYAGGAYDSTLNNCILMGNSAEGVGGGAYYGTLNNCTLTGNSAYWGGGGVYDSTLNNCILTANSASGGRTAGGGALGGTLNNCTLTGNSAGGWFATGGGAYESTLNNCIVY